MDPHVNRPDADPTPTEVLPQLDVDVAGQAPDRAADQEVDQAGDQAAGPDNPAQADTAAPVPDADPAAPPADGARPMLVLGGTPLAEAPTEPVPPPPAPEDVCRECGGGYGPEGYCDRCGAARPDESMHYTLDPGHGVGAACDRGIRHLTNEDAVAAYASHEGTRRVAMVVADGVSTAPRAQQASRGAVDTALEVLATSTSTGMAGVEASLVGALGRRLLTAAQAANDAVREVTESIDPGDTAPDASRIPKSGHPACTFAAAVVEGDTVAVGSIGDSRAYWFPDSGPDGAQVLSTDDSWANEEIRMGVDPEQAERGPHAHTITAWLGVDGPEPDPEVQHFTVTEPGWLMVCTDGLWNYASAPQQLHAALDYAAGTLVDPENLPETQPDPETADGATLVELPGSPAVQADPVKLAVALVDWANALGGQDNITVALARLEPTHP